MRVTVTDLVKRAGRSLGLEISRYRPFAARRAERLRALAIETVVDVGANTGQYGQELRHNGYLGRIVSFEPLEEAYRALELASASDPLWECHRFALGATDERGELAVAANLASSSLLSMTEEMRVRIPIVGTEPVSVRRLDGLGLRLKGPLMLKLDVQGYEARVLDGCGAILQHVDQIECELSLAPLYDSQAQHSEMVARLDGLGFEMVDLDPFFYDPADGRVLSFDALFGRRLMSAATAGSP